MTATQIVDKMLEAGPLDAGEFLSDFPSRRAGTDDLYLVIQKLLKLKEANGGQWSETGNINVSVFGGDPIENFRPEHATYDHFQRIIDFDGAVVDFNGEVIGPGIAQENPLDTFYGWQAYLDLTNEGPMTFNVTFGKNDVESGSFEPGLPPEVEDTVRSHFNEFKEKFIDQAMGEQVTEAKQPSTKGFEQISGDFGSPWDYGGTWVNEQTGDLIHFPGLDTEEAQEVETKSPVIDGMLVPADYKLIMGTLRLDSLDEWETTEENIRQRYADELTASRKFTVYRTSVESNEWLEKDWAREIAEIKQELEMDDEMWAKNTPAIKQAAIADRIGWHEFDHYPEKFTKAQLSSLLGIDL